MTSVGHSGGPWGIMGDFCRSIEGSMGDNG